ncbi:transcriptional regulator [Acidocella aquatica]|uniref:Transcriptional regulator n=2 Tax=Acidocella aquatica TaxID=1922313 RepID=A0ABQ6A4Y9_9PROT|nr:transcriptional regulator [Acidocella aquatica]
MKDQSILKAATELPASERDSRPMTADERKMARRRPRVTVIRRALRMTQEQFSAEFGIPLGTLRDWEQERAEPDAPARAYLRAIAGNAEAVAKALKTHPAPAAE